MNPDNEKRKRYIKMFQEMDFRAFRAMIMNYNESHRYDHQARQTERFAFGIVVLSVVVGSPTIYFKFTSRSTAGIGLSLAWSTSGLLNLYSQGPFWSSSLAERAQKHVNAGAEWHKIHQLARLYCFQLEVTPQKAVQWDQQYERYVSLLNAYRKASKITVIRGAAYDKHSSTDFIFKRMNQREEQLAAFQERESSKKTRASP